jgi:hypothetical protein
MSSLLILNFLQYSPFTIFWLGQPFSLWFSLIRFMQNYSSRSTLMEYNIPRSAYWNRLWILRTFVIIKWMHIQIYVHTWISLSKFIPVAQAQPLWWKSSLDSLSVSRTCWKKLLPSKNLVKFYMSVSICSFSVRKYSVFHMNVRNKKLPEAELLITFYSKHRITEATKFKCKNLIEWIYLWTRHIRV